MATIAPCAHLQEVQTMSEEIDASRLEQAKLFIPESWLRKGLAKYGRI